LEEAESLPDNFGIFTPLCLAVGLRSRMLSLIFIERLQV